MTFELCGYFDNNFGDDYMQKIVVHYMKEYEFKADNRFPISPIVLNEENVKAESYDKLQKLPKLTVTGCGFMINSFSVLKYELKWFLNNKKTANYCIGCNIEPFKNKFFEWLIAKKLNRFNYIMCRDKKSFEWLTKNCPKAYTQHIPDILFAFPKEWLSKSNKGKKLGIALMHISGDRADNPYYRSMAEIGDYWIETFGEDVILLAFDSGYEDDVFACKCVKELMRHKEKVKIVKHAQNGEIIKAYAECQKIVGARFHSAVLAMKTGIDFYPVIYREKMRNLISDTCYPIKGSEISAVDTEDIKEFLNMGQVEFELNPDYEKQVKDAIKRFKKYVSEMK